MGSRSGLVHQIFTPLPVGVRDGTIYRATVATCTGYKDKIKLSRKMLLPPECFRYTTMNFGGHAAVTPRTHRRPASRPFLQGARRASHCLSMYYNVQGHIHLTESPGFNADGAGSRMLLFWHILASKTPLWFAHTVVWERQQCVLACPQGSRLLLGISHSKARALSISD